MTAESKKNRGTPAFERYDMGVTAFWQEANLEQVEEQREWQQTLAQRADVVLSDEVFVSQLSVIYPESFHVGARTYICAHVYVWGNIKVGADCTVNPFSELRGTVRIGNGVRIGAHSSILGFNHGMDTSAPIYTQPLVSQGIEIGDGAWIGSHAVIMDGVTVGAHSIIGAGAVVTKDVPPWTVVGGNPARQLRDRRAPRGDAIFDNLQKISQTARLKIPQILARSWSEEKQAFLDRPTASPTASPTVRAWCDAIELADLFGTHSDMPVSVEHSIKQLTQWQDPVSGLIPQWGGADTQWSRNGHADVNYHVLAVGYALKLLGSGFKYPINVVEQMDSLALRQELDRQPWLTQGWQAGSWVDSVGTAMFWNKELFSCDTQIEALFGWLLTRCDPATGLWGRPNNGSGWLEPVNGFYRLTRGTFAQMGIPLPYPERTIDSVLTHAANERYFSANRGTACNVLDVIHPLWLAAKQTSYRKEEGENWARRQIERIARSWQSESGFSFALEQGAGWQHEPSLLGTEMWLAITWYLADFLGVSDVLGFRPQGIHKPEPAMTFGSVSL